MTIPLVTEKSQKSHSVTITSVTEKSHATPGAFKQASAGRQNTVAKTTLFSLVAENGAECDGYRFKRT